MAFSPGCSIDGCLSLCEPEIRLILCPGKKTKTLKNDLETLMQQKERIEQKIKELVSIDSEKEATRDVRDWMRNVEKRGEEATQLFRSLSGRSCWNLCSRYDDANELDELLRVVAELKQDKWDDESKIVRRKPSLISPPRQNQIPSINKQQDPWSLFLSFMAGGEADVAGDQFIETPARRIVDTVVECCGPGDESVHLALLAVAGSLKKHWTVSRWELAAERLSKIAASHQDREDITTGAPAIESILRFCYDSLDSDRSRLCLSSCALFDHSHTICELDIIAAWMGEGLLGTSVNIDEAYEQGRRVINKLRSAHLLEGSDWCDFYLSIDVHVRYVASLAAGDRLIRTSDPGRELQTWSAAKVSRVSIREHAIESLPESAEAWEGDARMPDATPVCPHLVVLLVGGNNSIKRIHDDFFRFTPQLRVLDLSNIAIVELPRSIGELKLLRFLKLREAKIKCLPRELGKLENLKQLDLSETKDLKTILRESISELSKLQALFLSNSGHKWGSSEGSGLTLEDLRGLMGIQQLSLTVETVVVLDRIKSLLATAVTGLTLKGVDFAGYHVRSAFSSLSRLEFVELSGCTRLGGELVVRSGHLGRLRELKLSGLPVSTISPERKENGPRDIKFFLPMLRHLGIWDCKSLKNLTWVGYVARLELVCLQKCEGITMLIEKDGPGYTRTGLVDGDDDGGISFPNLQFLVLFELPQLSSFSWRHPLRLPSLRTLRVKHCPSLTRLPFGRRSCEDIREIRGTREWWNGLEWDHGDIKMSFQRYFKQY